MQVVVGPVPSSSVRAFAGYAGQVLSEPGGPATDLPDDVVQRFAGYVQEWVELADRGPTLTWTAELPLEVAEYLVHAFYRLAQRLDQRAQVLGPQAPDEGRVFYAALVGGLLDALEEEGPSGAEFAAHLRTFWPGHED